jgi:hypothetical protein
VHALRSTPQALELEVPADAGNGHAHAGLPLARVLWHLPAPVLVSLIEALLLVCAPVLFSFVHLPVQCICHAISQ